MAFSLDDALALLQKWQSDNADVRLVFVGRGLEFSYSLGTISSVSGRVFTFTSASARVTFDTGVSSTAQLVLLGTKDSGLPSELSGLVDSGDGSAIILRGNVGDILAVIRDSEDEHV